MRERIKIPRAFRCYDADRVMMEKRMGKHPTFVMAWFWVLKKVIYVPDVRDFKPYYTKNNKKITKK